MAMPKGKVLVLDDARLWYEEKSKQIYFGTTDVTLGGGGFRMPIKPGSPLEKIARDALKAHDLTFESLDRPYTGLKRTWPSIVIGVTEHGEEVRISPQDAKRFNGSPSMLVGGDSVRRTSFLSFLVTEYPRSGVDALLLRSVTAKEYLFEDDGLWPSIAKRTLRLDDEMLAARPGSLDPLLNMSDKRSAARLLADVLMGTEVVPQGLHAAKWRAQLMAELTEGSIDSRNKTAYDVLFGNFHEDEEERTYGISDTAFSKYIDQLRKAHVFWSAFISDDASAAPLMEQVDNDGVLNVEVSASLSGATGSLSDGMRTLMALCNYAAERMNLRGGAVLLDAEPLLKRSKSVLELIERAGRTWRCPQSQLVVAVTSIETYADGDEKNIEGLYDRVLDLGDEPGKADFFDRFCDWDGTIIPGSER